VKYLNLRKKVRIGLTDCTRYTMRLEVMAKIVCSQTFPGQCKQANTFDFGPNSNQYLVLGTKTVPRLKH